MKKNKRSKRYSKSHLKNNKGLSPIITTVLLIGLVIAVIAVVFLWFRGIVEEGVTKFGKNIKLVCDDVRFDSTFESTSATEGILSVVNTGNTPLFKLNIKIDATGNFRTKDLSELSAQWPQTGLTQGMTFRDTITIGSAEKITILPTLMGTSERGKKTFVCGGQYGKEIEI